MGLNTVKGVFVANTSTGNQTVNLPNNFDPKVVILWTSQQTAADTTTDDGAMAIGYGTYRGAAVQQRYVCTWDEDAALTMDCSRGGDVGAVLLGVSDGAATVDFEADLVSLNDGSPATFVINWVDAPASAIRIHYLALGGSDISDAFVGQFDLAQAATQDVTITSGFGQPDLLLFIHGSRDSGVASAGDAGIMFGVAKSDTVRQCTYWQSRDGSASGQISKWQKQRAILFVTSAGAADTEGDLSAKAEWPTDGFELTFPDQPGSAAIHIGYIALKGTVQSALGVNTAVTSGTPPVTQDNACGFAPLAGLFWGGNLIASTLIITSDATLGSFFLGGTDGTNEGCTIESGDDVADPSNTARRSSEAKAVQFYNQVMTLQSEADASFSGNNLRLSWNDIDTVAREYVWLALGAAAAAAETIPDLVMARR